MASSFHEIELTKPKFIVDLEPISPRLRAELIHPARNGLMMGVQYSPNGDSILAADHYSGIVQTWAVAIGEQLRQITESTRLNELYATQDQETVFLERRPQELNYARVLVEGKPAFNLTVKGGGISVIDTKTGKLKRVLVHSPPRDIRRWAASGDGSVVVTLERVQGVYTEDYPPHATIWNANKGAHRSLEIQDNGPIGFKLAADGSQIASSISRKDNSTQFILITDTRTGETAQTFEPPFDRSFTHILLFNPTLSVLITGHVGMNQKKSDGKPEYSIVRWDLQNGKLKWKYRFEDGGTTPECALSPDGSTVAMISRRTAKRQLKIFDVDSGQLQHNVLLGDETSNSFLVVPEPVYGPDGKWIVVMTQELKKIPEIEQIDPREAAQTRIHLIDIAKGEIKETMIAPQGFIRSAAFSPDGKTLATGGLGRVLLWDMTQPPGKFSAATPKQ